jgi:hypothetical protein
MARSGAGLVAILVLAVACGQPSGSTSPTPGATQSASTFHQEALALVNEYESARAARDYDRAWSLLAPEMQLVYGDVAAFADDSDAYLAAGAAPFDASLAAVDAAAARALMTRDGLAISAIRDETLTVVRVHHPGISDPASAVDEVFVVGDVVDAGWRVWLVD